MRLNSLIFKVMILSSVFLYLHECDRIDDSEFDEPESTHGIIRDFRNIDSCGLVIELDDGTIIVPYLLDTSLLLSNGQEVEVAYTEVTDTDYACKAGLLAKITWLKMVGCSPIIMQEMDYFSTLTNLPSDPFKILNANIENNCLNIKLSYSGGCEVHEFIMTYTELPGFSQYSGTLTLSHNAHGDMCKSLITNTICYDLTSLQQPGSDMIRLTLIKSGDEDYQLIIDYYY